MYNKLPISLKSEGYSFFKRKLKNLLLKHNEFIIVMTEFGYGWDLFYLWERFEQALFLLTGALTFFLVVS